MITMQRMKNRNSITCKKLKCFVKNSPIPGKHLSLTPPATLVPSPPFYPIFFSTLPWFLPLPIPHPFFLTPRSDPFRIVIEMLSAPNLIGPWDCGSVCTCPVTWQRNRSCVRDICMVLVLTPPPPLLNQIKPLEFDLCLVMVPRKYIYIF